MFCQTFCNRITIKGGSSGQQVEERATKRVDVSARINRLAVDPKCRRKGIAKKLVEKVERLLEKHGASIICALIETSNEDSINLFQEMGYFKHPEILYVSKRKSEDV